MTRASETRMRVRVNHMQAMTKDTASAPLFTPLGYTVPLRGPLHFHFLIDGRLRTYATPDMQSVSFLLDLHPDIEHWRALFPGDRRTRIDVGAACAHFARECRALGEYIPQAGVSSADPVNKV